MPRKRAAVGRLPAEEKIIPNSLCVLLIELVYSLHPNNLELAAAEIDECKPKYASEKTFTAARIYKIRDHKSPPEVWELEAIAHKFGVPLGLLTLFSRLRANKHHGSFDDTNRILHTLKYISENTDADQEFTVKVLEDWATELNGEGFVLQRRLDL